MRPRILARRSHRTRDDGGFLLIETVVAIGVVTIVMTGLAVLLINVSSATTQQRNAQTASRLAVSALDRARAVGAAAAVSGRDSTSSSAQLNTTPATPDFPATAPSVAPWLTGMQPAVDPTARTGDGRTSAVPTVAEHQTLNGRTFSVSYFVGYCWRAPTGSGDCVSTKSTGAIQYVRVVVAVAWRDSSCPAAGCAYVSATLLNGSGDPVFNVNQSTTTLVEMNPVPDQVTAPGATVDGVTGLSGCASACPVSAADGAPPYILSATGLPAGLSMATSGADIGLITGTAPTTKQTSTVTISVTDAFLNTDSTSFTWTIGTPPANPPTVTAPSTVPAATIGRSTSLSLAYTCPNGGCTFTLAGGPGGVKITGSSGTTSGTVTLSGTVSGSTGTFHPVVTATDSKGLTGSATFIWTVGYAPLTAGSPPDRTDRVYRSVSVDLSGYVSGGSGSVRWADTGRYGTLPDGLSVSSSGVVSGTPNNTGRWTVQLRVTDSVTGESVYVSFRWTVSRYG